jgi:MFS family permease
MTGRHDLNRNRDYTRLWTGGAVSELGATTALFVLPLLGYAITGSAVLAGLPGAVYLLGLVSALLPAGVLVDRFDRRHMLIAAHVLGVLAYASLAAAGFVAVLTLAHLVVVALLAGVVAGVTTPAETAAVRSIVARQELPTALSQNQARQHVAALVGGPLGGFLYAVARPLPFVAALGGHAVAAVQVARLCSDLSPGHRETSAPIRDLVDGVRYVTSRPYFRTVAVFGACCNLVVNAVFFVAVMRLVQAGVSPGTVGLVDALAGAGGIVGAIIAPWIIHRVPTGWLTIAVAWSWVPLLVPLIFWSSPAVVGAMLFLGLLLNPAGNAGAQSYRAAVTPRALQGRVSSSMSFLAMSVLPLAPLLGGLLLEHTGGPTAIAGLLVAAVLTALIPTLSRSVRSVPRPRDWPVLDEDGAVGSLTQATTTRE